jgi:adenylate cyclase
VGIEIERKFLLANDSWRQAVTKSVAMRQGYLASSSSCSVRVRLTADEGRLNIKSATLGIERQEFDYDIPRADAIAMLDDLCGGKELRKTRHFVPYGTHLWEIDEFAGVNAGLIVAEVELGAVDEVFTAPPWLGPEVSRERRYYNVCLIERPYSQWGKT